MLSLPLPQQGANHLQPLFHRGRVLNALGVLHLLDGNVDEARGDFERAVRERPAYAVAQNNLGVASVLHGAVDSAGAYLSRAIEEEPTLRAAHANAGVVMLLQGDRNSAVAQFARALEATESGPLAWKTFSKLRPDELGRDRLTARLTGAGVLRPFDYVLYLDLIEPLSG
jgi:Tfp pilus assembly protein PilF